MRELFDVAFSTTNLIPTILLLVILLYWLTVIVGILDLNFLNVEVDTEADLDLEIDVHTDVEINTDINIHTDTNIHPDTEIHSDAHISANIMGSILMFFNLGKMPFMFLMSFVLLPMWIISILTTHYFNINSFAISTALLIPNFVVSLFVAKILTLPFVKIFAKLDTNVGKEISLSGKIGTVIIPIRMDKVGQVTIEIDDAPVSLNAKTVKGIDIDAGEKVLVIEYFDEDNCYIVEPY